MRRSSHLGIPTEIRRRGERRLEKFKMYLSGYEESPCGIGWMHFEAGRPVPELVRAVPHVAREVDDLARELESHQLSIEPNSQSQAVTVAFVVHNGAPVASLQIDRARAAAVDESRGAAEEDPPATAGGEEAEGGS